MSSYRVLVIEDDRMMRNSLVDLIEAKGWNVKALSRAVDAQRWISQYQPDVILSDVRMPEMSGLELLASLEEIASPPIVLISAHGDIPMAVEAMNHGAYSFLEKPYEPQRLLTVLTHAADQHRMREGNQRLRQRLQELSGLDKVLIGQSQQMQRLRETIAVVADSDAAVLVHGETGTGKDLVAHALHDISARCSGPYIAVNAAQFSAEQLPELARSATDGTLFLDEICACPIDVQPMLLRLIEAKEILSPGSTAPEKIELRIISATNENVEEAVEQGKLRRDLLYRLDTFGLHLLPLRQRLDDLALLASRFLNEFALAYETAVPDITETDLAVLMAHPWPGNVRELRNVCERRIILQRHGAGDMAQAISGHIFDTLEKPGLREAVAAFERQMISRAIQAHQGKMDAVADHLGIGRRTLNEKIVKLGMDKDALL